MAAAASARILGAAVVMIGDLNKDRLAHAKKVGFEPIDLNAHDRLGELVDQVWSKDGFQSGTVTLVGKDGNMHSSSRS